MSSMHVHTQKYSETFNITDMEKIKVLRIGANLQNIMLDLQTTRFMSASCGGINSKPIRGKTTIIKIMN